jgi:hypothetical protein
MRHSWCGNWDRCKGEPKTMDPDRVKCGVHELEDAYFKAIERVEDEQARATTIAREFNAAQKYTFELEEALLEWGKTFEEPAQIAPPLPTSNRYLEQMKATTRLLVTTVGPLQHARLRKERQLGPKTLGELLETLEDIAADAEEFAPDESNPVVVETVQSIAKNLRRLLHEGADPLAMRLWKSIVADNELEDGHNKVIAAVAKEIEAPLTNAVKATGE